ncbi:MAG TPA: sulfatase/phosphatase domain-containing protein, partial [Pirellulales bacterium]|nr:sulfatase/phosphatase domain-containing protein [Pirellulales bacterium]
CEHLMHNQSLPKWEGVRGSRYTYARYFEQTPVYEALFDLDNDPDQLENLVGEPNHAETLQAMRRRCDQLRDEYGGPYKP